MPIYEYVCEDCGTKFEALRPMSAADEPIACKNCHQQHTHRAISVCFAQGEGISSKSSYGGCNGCRGGNCASCGH